MMNKLSLKVCLFLIPFILAAIVPVIFLALSKENFYSLNKVVISNKPYLVGYGYNENNYKYLKWSNLKDNPRYDIVTLGSSRVLQFRKGMFNSSFYNAGYTIESINDFKPFLLSISKEKYPKYLIISLDQWMFNKSWDNLNSKPTKTKWTESFTFLPSLLTVRSIWKDLLSHKYSISLFSEKTKINIIGLNAYVNGRGVRNDGSFSYGNHITDLLKNDTVNEAQFADVYERIRVGNNRFQYGKHINAKSKKVLNDFLQYCNNNKICVIAFLPPFADKVYNRMIESGKYQYFKDVEPQIGVLFKKYNYELYDFSSSSSCNSSDAEVIDGLHGGEKTYLHIVLNMLRSGSKLNEVADSAKLKRDLVSATTRYNVY